MSQVLARPRTGTISKKEQKNTASSHKTQDILQDPSRYLSTGMIYQD
jgi:hypothetical protein